ncbi:MAG: TatD family hydrolase [Porphyromonadaceae bacterium]|nr:TatD family hydrolase [Porphyromonadaceae bacterium]
MHTHHLRPVTAKEFAVCTPYPHYPLSIVAERPDCRFSVGVHPYECGNVTEEMWQTVVKTASLPQVVALGECGLDATCPVPMEQQGELFERHITLSEELKKPLVIHCVKAFDMLISLRRSQHPTQQWIIHGFRGKPQQAEQLCREGFLLSFGYKYNPDTLKQFRPGEVLLESDEELQPMDRLYGRVARLWKMHKYLVVGHTARKAESVLQPSPMNPKKRRGYGEEP